MKRRIVAIAAALVVAIIGAIAVISYANSADARAVAGQQVTEVFIAAKPVPQGTTAKAAVDQGLIARQKVVAKGVPTGAMTALVPSRQNQVALADIPAGTVVLDAGFGAKALVKTSNAVPQGKVAITVSIDAPNAVAPFIKAGAHIAVYDTLGSQDSQGPQLTGVVLPDVDVLRVNGNSSGSGSTSTSSSSTLMVTVVVAPQQSTRLVHAIQTGQVYAGLLGHGARVDPRATINDNTVVKH
ncbi:MAG: RcpC/CpaB family pilus assembly protein [Marmoricola sp.]